MKSGKKALANPGKKIPGLFYPSLMVPQRKKIDPMEL